MKKIVALSLLAACLMSAPVSAAPAPSSDVPAAAQVLTDAQMADVVGGMINVTPTGPAFPNPTLPVGPYIKEIRSLLGTDPGHFSTALGADLGFASFVRANNPYTDAQGLAKILIQR